MRGAASASSVLILLCQRSHYHLAVGSALLLIREVAVAILCVIVGLPSVMAPTYLRPSRQGPRGEKAIIAGSPLGFAHLAYCFVSHPGKGPYTQLIVFQPTTSKSVFYIFLIE